MHRFQQFYKCLHQCSFFFIEIIFKSFFFLLSFLLVLFIFIIYIFFMCLLFGGKTTQFFFFSSFISVDHGSQFIFLFAFFKWCFSMCELMCVWLNVTLFFVVHCFGDSFFFFFLFLHCPMLYAQQWNQHTVYAIIQAYHFDMKRNMMEKKKLEEKRK